MNEVITLTGYEATWWAGIALTLGIIGIVVIFAGFGASLDEGDWSLFGGAFFGVVVVFGFANFCMVIAYDAIRDSERNAQQSAWLASEGYTNIDVSDGEFTAADPDGKFTQGEFLPQGNNEYWVVTRDAE